MRFAVRPGFASECASLAVAALVLLLVLISCFTCVQLYRLHAPGAPPACAPAGPPGPPGAPRAEAFLGAFRYAPACGWAWSAPGCRGETAGAMPAIETAGGPGLAA